MREDTWQAIEAEAIQFPGSVYGPVPDAEIEAAEAALGVTFDKDHRAFLARYGSGFFTGTICGIRRAELMSLDFWSIVEVTRWYQSKDWPGLGQMYVIGTNDFGPIAIASDGTVYYLAVDGPWMKLPSFESYLRGCLNLPTSQAQLL